MGVVSMDEGVVAAVAAGVFTLAAVIHTGGVLAGWELVLVP